MNCDFLSLHLWTSFWQSTKSQVHNHLVNNVYTYFLVYILFLLLLVYIFIFKPGMIGKNNHPCTTPGRLVLYDLYLEYFKYLNQFYAWDWKICMKVNIYQEASKNTNAHWLWEWTNNRNVNKMIVLSMNKTYNHVINVDKKNLCIHLDNWTPRLIFWCSPFWEHWLL